MVPVLQRDKYKWQRHKNILKIPSLFLYDLKMCIQRIRKGYCDDDLVDIRGWFLHIMPDMLQEYKENRNRDPVKLGKDENGNDTVISAEEEWDELDSVLDKLIFLFAEAAKDTCTQKNPYEEEHLKMMQEFWDRYGMLGEKLGKDDENVPDGYKRMHFPSEVPEFADIDMAWHAEEERLEAYRNDCKNEAFKVFSEYFWDLQG